MANTFGAEMRHRYRVPVHDQPNDYLVRRFGAEAEALIRELGSACGVIAFDERIDLYLAEVDPMARSQVRDALRAYLAAAENAFQDDGRFSPYHTRTEHGDPIVVVGGALAKLGATDVEWWHGRCLHASENRIKHFVVATGYDDGATIGVAGFYGDTEQTPDEVRIRVMLDEPTRAFLRTGRMIGGGFWHDGDAVKIVLGHTL